MFLQKSKAATTATPPRICAGKPWCFSVVQLPCWLGRGRGSSSAPGLTTPVCRAGRPRSCEHLLAATSASCSDSHNNTSAGLRQYGCGIPPERATQAAMRRVPDRCDLKPAPACHGGTTRRDARLSAVCRVPVPPPLPPAHDSTCSMSHVVVAPDTRQATQSAFMRASLNTREH